MTVLVGVYGSADSRATIRLAAQEALYQNAPLIALTAYPRPAGLVSRCQAGSRPTHPRRRPSHRRGPPPRGGQRRARRRGRARRIDADCIHPRALARGAPFASAVR